MKKINLGIIGLGDMGKIHLTNALLIKEIKVLGVADVSRSAQRYAKNLGVLKTYNNYKDLIDDSNIDAVIISTPNHLHYECAITASEKGKDILMEKPLASNVEEGKKILSHVKKNGIKLMMGYPMRFSHNYCKIKEQLMDGLYGKILIASATNITAGPFSSRRDDVGPTPVPNWWLNPKLSGGGALMDLGCHLINLFVWYFGDILDIRSYLGYNYNMDFEDHAISLIKFKDGPIATINVGWFTTKGAKIRVDLYGAVQNVSGFFLKDKKILDYGVDIIKKTLGKVDKSVFFRELDYFIRSIITCESINPSGEEGLNDLKIIAKAYKNSILMDIS